MLVQLLYSESLCVCTAAPAKEVDEDDDDDEDDDEDLDLFGELTPEEKAAKEEKDRVSRLCVVHYWRK